MSAGLILFMVVLGLLVIGGIVLAIVLALQPNDNGNVIPPDVPFFPNREQARIDVGGSSGEISLSLNEDGNILAVGQPNWNNRGRVVFYQRSGGEWSETATIEGAVTSLFGTSLDLDAAGARILIGAPGGGAAGAAYVYEDIEGTWTLEQTWLGASGQFGKAVALNDDDGTYAAIGEPSSNTIWVYHKEGTWGTGVSLTPTVEGSVGFGSSVAITDAGAAIVAGLPSAAVPGAVELFLRTGTVWAVGQLFTGPSNIGSAAQGTSVAISGTDGGTLAFGGPGDNAAVGATWVLRPGNTPAKLIGSGAIGAGRQGASIALSNSGRTLIVGAPDDNNGRGAYWAFTRGTDLQWVSQGKYVGTSSFGSNLGTSVAMSRDGTTGAFAGENHVVWVFNFQLVS